MATLPGPAHAQPPRRLQRAGPALALAAAVLLVHAWLAALLAPGAPRPGTPRASPVLLRSLPAEVAVAAPAAAAPAADALLARAPRRAAAPAAAPEPARRPALAGHPAAMPADDLPAQADLRTAVTSPVADAAASAEPDGEPPPLYATRVPPPVTLHYTLRHNGREVGAVLAWQHDGSAYRLTLDALGADGRPLLAQASTGALDGNGLAPERFVDRRAGGRQRAVNFRRELGQIAYSGPGQTHPAWPGAQDRLSWLAQLAAILAAAEGPPADAPDRLRLFVADASGQAGLWTLQRLADDGAAGVHWRREPPRPEGLRIDLWLPAPGTVSAHQAPWPLRLLYAVPRSGAVLELVAQPPP